MAEFRSGSFEHNWQLLLRVIDDKDVILLPVSMRNIVSGTVGSVNKCAAALALYEYFGASSYPKVYENLRDGPHAGMSHGDFRYIIPLDDRNAFKPQAYDKEKGKVNPGHILIQGSDVRVSRRQQRSEPREVQLSNAKAWKEKSAYKTPAPRQWNIGKIMAPKVVEVMKVGEAA